MAINYSILVVGNSFRFKEGFLGFSTVVLVRADGFPPVLFDTGHHVTRHVLVGALKERGISPSEISKIFISHLHFDHANNIELFPQADIYVSAEEWDYARRPAMEDLFCNQSLNVYLESRNLHLLHDAEGELLPGLYYRHAPGHTPGSYLLHFRLQGGLRVVLAGDACKTYRELVNASVVSEFDPFQRSHETLEWIASNADIVVPGHYPELRRTSAGWTWDESMHIDIIAR